MQVSELTTEQITRTINLLVDSKGIEVVQAEKILALSLHIGLSVKESFNLEFSSYDDCTIEYHKQEYLVCDDSEADDKWDESLESYIEECILHEIPKHLRRYFNNEAWKSDARCDGRGHCLSSYDGNESEEIINGTRYYIYRTN